MKKLFLNAQIQGPGIQLFAIATDAALKRDGFTWLTELFFLNHLF